ATDPAPATATAPHCPPDPEAADQLALAAPAEQWPAEVRLRIRVRADGAIDCVRLVSTTHDGFVEDCRRMLGERHAPRRGEDGAPVDAWLTFLCQFEPKH
ncbi:MAG: hypothetical protein OXT09_37100, partial [Myxococcales bacterium]|nr:hypothetical protein [Myxococcales bacterium]